MFEVLRKLFRKPEMSHPVFGHIVYQDENVWEGGVVRFVPAGRDVEVLIHAGPSGPNEAHVQFVQELTERWPSLVAAWEPLVRERLDGRIKIGPSDDIWSRLRLEGIDVFDAMPSDQSWEQMFWCEEAGHSAVIFMEGWVPKEVGLDG